MRAVLLAVLAGCAHPTSVLPADAPADRPHDVARHFTIWLGGARVGTAVEHEHWTDTGMTLARTETLRFMRGDDEINLATSIVIDASVALDARRVQWTEISADTRSAEAVRTGDGWRLSTGGFLEMPAVPAELVPLIVRRDGRFAGPIFLPARGFVTGNGRVDLIAAHRMIARLVLDAGAVVEATIDLGDDGAPARIVDGEGVIALRTSEAQAQAPFTPVDLIAATSLPITGTHHGDRLILAGNVALPSLPGQRAHLANDTIARSGSAGPRSGAEGGVELIEVELSARLVGDLPGGVPSRERSAEIRTLVDTVRERITPSLAAGPTSSRDATTATSGDCTTFALAYAALAASHGIATRVVTGLRVDENRLIRHRWAISWTGTRWIAIDAAFGRVPAGGNLIGLAVHDADDAGLVAGEAALTQVRGAAWAP